MTGVQTCALPIHGGSHGIREHILRMSNMAAKLKSMEADLELKPALIVPLVMASLPPLQEEMAFQARLPRLAQDDNGQERYRNSFFCK